jgi:two-component system cell cycle sensor histidine kinase/response regulator CckA
MSDYETVLIVDGKSAVCTSLCLLLAQAGYVTIPATNGEEALELSRSHVGTIHLLITDVRIPKLNGFELAAAVQSEKPGIRLLVMSGRWSGALLARKLKIPFIHKPFTATAFQAKVAEVLAADPPPTFAGS